MKSRLRIPRFGVSSAIALGLACFVSIAGCGGGGVAGSGSSACLEPTLAQCQNLDWLNTDACGMAERDAMLEDPESACNRLLVAEARRLSEGLEEELVATPDGGTAMAIVVPNPDKRPTEIVVPAGQLCYGQQDALHATTEGLSADDQALRAQWEANGSRVESCEEYVYDKYYDYTMFEDAVIARFDDFSYLADVAFGPSTEPTAFASRAARGEYLRMKPLGGGLQGGQEMTVQTIGTAAASCTRAGGSPGVTKNVFFAMPLSLVDNPALQSQLVQGCGEAPPPLDLNAPDPYAPAWQWHLDRRAAAVEAEFPEVALDAMQDKVLTFQQVLSDYVRNTSAVPACCSGGSDPASTDCCDEYQAERTSLEARLRELFDAAVAAGCLDPNVSTLCDWSPRYFVEELRSSFCPTMSADYQSCMDATGNDFEALDNYQFPPLADGSTFMPPGVYGPMSFNESASRVSEFIRLQAQWLEAYDASLPTWLLDSTGHAQVPGAQAGANNRAGNEDFGAFYAYDASWGTTNYGASAPATGNLCDVGLEAKASASAGGWVFGSDDITVLDTYARLGTAHGAEWHFDILDLAIWTWGKPPDESWTISGEIPFLEDVPLLEKEKVFYVEGIPVLVRGGLTGTLGLAYEFGATGDPPTTCDQPKDIHASVGPYAQLDAFGDVGIGATAKGAGAKRITAAIVGGLGCELTVLRLDFPFTVGAYIYPPAPATETSPALDWGLQVSSKLDLGYRTLDGRVYLFLEVGLEDFGLKLEQDLFKWTGYKGRTTLFTIAESERVDLAALQNLLPEPSDP